MDKIIKTFLKGKFIGVKDNYNTFTIYKKFNVDSFKNATLSVTALGLYFVEINGKRVEDNYLTPGFTNYNKMLQVQHYNVGNYLLKNEENQISITVNKGWYAGRFGCDGQNQCFGSKGCACCCLSLENDENIAEILTDESWKARESAIKFSGLYDGETIDYFCPLKELEIEEYKVDKSILVEQICPFVKDKERFKVEKIIKTPRGEIVYDFSQNIAGVVEILSNSDKEIVLQFGEILDENGNFYIDNLRKATGTAKIRTGNKKKITFEFTYFGFRYVKIVSENVKPDEIVAVARYTDLKRTGYLEVENEKLNRFIQNTLWSQRDNFVDIPTDCPQRDERLGWTGDLNAFCTTASYTYDICDFLKKWLASLRDDQKENGVLPVVTPDVLKNFNGTMSMWCDACIMVPWKLYNHYGDISFLQDNYEMMKKYLSKKEDNCENGMITKGFEFGDWLALDSEECTDFKNYGGTDLRFISNVFYYHCLQLFTKIAKILGKEDDEYSYGNRAEVLLSDIRKEYFTYTGRLAVPTITAHSLALAFGITTKQNRERVAKDLNENVIKHNFHVTTGFIGTPYLLFALADNGYFDTAEKVLLNEEYPGWIHEVNMGATTVWERWNSLLENGIPNPDGMTSFNHYAYGSMVEFLYRRIAGIENRGLGFDNIIISPHPVKAIGNVKCSFISKMGKIRSDITFLNDEIIYEIEVPSGVKATLSLKNEDEIILENGVNIFKRKFAESGDN